MCTDYEPCVAPLVSDTNVGFVADDLGVANGSLIFLDKVPCEHSGVFLIVQDCLVRDVDVMDITKNLSGHSRTDAVRYAVGKDQSDGMIGVMDTIERTCRLEGLNRSDLGGCEVIFSVLVTQLELTAHTGFLQVFFVFIEFFKVF